VSQLGEALFNSRRIGMAMGILMARHGKTEQQAVDLLRDRSSRGNVKPHEVAAQVAYTGDLPAKPGCIA
jgi:AmiR/NasT family two-component response regulator